MKKIFLALVVLSVSNAVVSMEAFKMQEINQEKHKKSIKEALKGLYLSDKNAILPVALFRKQPENTKAFRDTLIQEVKKYKYFKDLFDNVDDPEKVSDDVIQQMFMVLEQECCGTYQYISWPFFGLATSLRNALECMKVLSMEDWKRPMDDDRTEITMHINALVRNVNAGDDEALKARVGDHKLDDAFKNDLFQAAEQKLALYDDVMAKIGKQTTQEWWDDCTKKYGPITREKVLNISEDLFKEEDII